MATPTNFVSKNTSNKTYVCPYEGCESVFANRYKLRVHIRIHTGEFFSFRSLRLFSITLAEQSKGIHVQPGDKREKRTTGSSKEQKKKSSVLQIEQVEPSLVAHGSLPAKNVAASRNVSKKTVSGRATQRSGKSLRSKQSSSSKRKSEDTTVGSQTDQLKSSGSPTSLTNTRSNEPLASQGYALSGHSSGEKRPLTSKSDLNQNKHSRETDERSISEDAFATKSDHRVTCEFSASNGTVARLTKPASYTSDHNHAVSGGQMSLVAPNFERPYVCDIADCKRSYTNPAHLKRHKQTAHREKEDIQLQLVKCPFENCIIGLISPSNLKKHIKRKHEEHPYKCTFEGCTETFRKHRMLTFHFARHTAKFPFKCTHEGCEESFPQELKLRRHEKQHEGYICGIDGCEEKFNKWTLLRKHKAASHKKMWVCSICSETFSQKSWLKRHQEIHGEKRNVFICPKEDCGRTYLEQRNLAAHIKSYHEGKRFKCEIDGCGRLFTAKQKLLLHSKMHDPNVPLKKKKLKKKRRATLKLCGIDTRKVASDDKEIACESEDNISREIFSSEKAKTVSVFQSEEESSFCENVESKTDDRNEKSCNDEDLKSLQSASKSENVDAVSKVHSVDDSGDESVYRRLLLTYLQDVNSSDSILNSDTQTTKSTDSETLLTNCRG